MAHKDVVDKVLEHATELVNIDLVLIDREFEHIGLKDICEEYGVRCLNSSKMDNDKN